MKKLITTVAMIAATSAISMQAQAQSRDYINIVGSSTVYPFSTVVAERFGKATQFKTPKVESTGSGGGIKLFCQGVGVQFPDITNASRAIKSSEVEMCKENGVTGIVEVLIGYDGIVIGNSSRAKQLDLSRKDLFLALAKEVPDPQGSEKLVENPYKVWSDVNPSLPNTKIEVLGPPPTSGTRDAFVELVMEEGCKEIDWIADIKKQSKAESDKAKSKKLKNKFKSICHTVREDGAFVEAGENDNLIVQKLNANPNALGIFGFSFLDQNIDQIQGSAIDGQDPTFESIADGSYPVSRPLYFYVKKAHVDMIPGIREYLAEFTSKKAAGEEGYLTEKGMIPLNSVKLNAVREKVESLTTL
ncbi:PstS family phosphate ABC transporter substrate-binding protein [Alteromonas sp. ASW11-130]|uniref:PstS family phosphate ABC transporter substrate-binding protein n=1 Tax=Alteromonas sp. ASW11-130 TaxID=3015775 RepID=UPI002241CDA7|nr:PstS family phosphate ABC transporter substrate-binding protein [Alteromonas sp. ASW11-130]MCW8092749.1 PstS family phosphate ABC transporter substrate-binding protein [Alteromonas sp. ASW11-130]